MTSLETLFALAEDRNFKEWIWRQELKKLEKLFGEIDLKWFERKSVGWRLK